MRRTLLVVLALAVALAFTGVVSAAEQAAQPTHKEAKEVKGNPYKGLDLTKEQKQKIKAIRQQAKTDMEKAATPQEKATIHKAANEKIKEVLTEKQREQLASNSKPEAKTTTTAAHEGKHKVSANHPTGAKIN